MRLPIGTEAKCFAFGWIPAWAVAIFLSSALIAVSGVAPVSSNCGLACTLAVADEMSPQAKLLFGFAMGAVMLAARQRRPSTTAMLAVRDGFAAAAAMAIVLAILPEAWSRGFGIGLFGTRFSAGPTAIYLASAAIGGGIGTLLERSCRRRLLVTYVGGES